MLNIIHACLRYIKAMFCILFGLSILPSLNRKAFLHKGLSLFLIRWPLSSLFTHLLIEYTDINSHEIISNFHMILLFAILFIFIVPYFQAIYKRLLNLGFHIPCLTTIVIGLFICMFLFKLSDNEDLLTEILTLAVFIFVYLILLPWKDAPSHQKNNSSNE